VSDDPSVACHVPINEITQSIQDAIIDDLPKPLHPDRPLKQQHKHQRRAKRHNLFHPDVKRCRQTLHDHSDYFSQNARVDGVRRWIAEINNNPQVAEVYWKTWKQVKSYESLFDLARAFMFMSSNVSAWRLSNEDSQKLRKTYESRALQLLKSISLPRLLHLNIGPRKLPEAQTFLGKCYAGGLLGLRVNHNKAFKLYILAAKHGDDEGTYAASLCYENGLGTTQDKVRAVQYLERAAKLNNSKAAHKYGMLLVSGGKEVSKAPTTGKMFVDRAVKGTDESVAEFVHDLATLHDYHPDMALLPDSEVAFGLYYKAATLGYPESQYVVARCFETGRLVDEIDYNESFYWFAKAAEQHHPPSQLKLSSFYLNGLTGVVSANETKSFEWALMAAHNGLAEAEYGVGYFYQNGIGTPKDYDQARRWYMRAAHQNYEKATLKVRELRLAKR
jgi:TPR repeat protein